MNAIIREAGERQAAAAHAARELEEAERTSRAARMEASRRSIDLLVQGLETLASLLADSVEPEASYCRQVQADPEHPSEIFFIPSWSKYSRWYMRKVPGWFLTTSARWDAALRMLGESDLRVAILKNGKTSRHLPLVSSKDQRRLATSIVECCARHGLIWPADGPDFSSILTADHETDA